MFQIIAAATLLAALPARADDRLIGPSDAWTAAEAGRLQIIDIRTPPEYHWTGSPKTAARADWWQLAGTSGFLTDILRIVTNDRTRPLALICARGVRSSKATAFLRSHGFTNVRDIGEGMLGSRAGPGWLDRKLPLG